MRISLIILCLVCVVHLHAATTLHGAALSAPSPCVRVVRNAATHVPIIFSKPHKFSSVTKKWNYWSMGIACGAGVAFFGHMHAEQYEQGLPDVRLSIERSWYLTNNLTASFDFSLFTPTVRCGYLLGSRTRVSCGIGLWLFGWYSAYGLRRLSEYVEMLDQGVVGKMQQELNITNVFTFTPSVSFDHFLSDNCFLRVTASYDRAYLRLNEDHMFAVAWPQLTMGLNFRF